MIQKRNNVFETNSSSTHSVSFSRFSSVMARKSSLCVRSDNYVHVKCGEFGWEIENYDDPYDKLQYIVTMLLETEGKNVSSIKDLFETNGFKLINNAVANFCDCDGIWIDEDLGIRSYENWNGTTCYYISHNGYIDHQSHENYNSVQDFLDDYDIDVTDFIFNYGVVVHTDNDNH